MAGPMPSEIEVRPKDHQQRERCEAIGIPGAERTPDSDQDADTTPSTSSVSIGLFIPVSRPQAPRTTPTTFDGSCRSSETAPSSPRR